VLVDSQKPYLYLCAKGKSISLVLLGRWHGQSWVTIRLLIDFAYNACISSRYSRYASNSVSRALPRRRAHVFNFLYCIKFIRFIINDKISLLPCIWRSLFCLHRRVTVLYLLHEYDNPTLALAFILACSKIFSCQ
jgi:hypothetical protein